jgi:AAA domain/DnaB-like helicase N terminal domain
LGCLLQSPELIPKVLDEGVSALMFDDLRRRNLFQSLLTMHGEGAGIDLITIQSRFKNQDWFVQTGGIGWLNQVQEAAPSAANWAFYIPGLKQAHAKRNILHFADRLQSLAGDPSISAERMFEDAEASINAMRDHAGYSRLPGIVDASEFMASEIALPRELVHGVLHQGSKLVLGGASKSYKTWTLLDLAVSVASGQAWLSFETEKGKVLFINLEIQPGFMQRRIEAVARAKDVSIEPGQLDVWNLRGHAGHYNTLVAMIKERVCHSAYSLIVIDPVYKLYGDLDENSASAVAQLLNAFESLAVDTGAAVAFGAHYSKGNQSAKSSIDRISGSGVFARDPDSILSFTEHVEEEAFTLECTLRNFRPLDPFVVRWDYPLMRLDNQLDPARLKPRAGRTKEHDPLKLLSAVTDTTAENPISICKWAERLHMSRTTLAEYLGEMRTKAWIATVGAGSTARQHITEAGLKAVNGRGV